MGARRNDRERERKCCLSRNTGSPQDKRVRERQSPEAERELFVFRTTREESTSEGLVWGQGAGVGVGGVIKKHSLPRRQELHPWTGEEPPDSERSRSAFVAQAFLL